jgi:GMP synthase (glutamine-hydrolysing)
VNLLIVKAGSAVDELAARGDFEDWFRESLGVGEAEAPLVAPYAGDALPDPASVPAALVTGSSAMVTDEEPWSVELEAWLRALVELGRPVLGVCYGHQLLAKALGGRVERAAAGPEVGTVRIELTAEGRRSPLFAGLPAELVSQASHEQEVVLLPRGALRLARNAHGANQAFAFGPRALGVQFHPEFDAQVVRGYLTARGAELAAAGLDVERLAAEARDSEHGRAILANFLRLAGADR